MANVLALGLTFAYVFLAMLTSGETSAPVPHAPPEWRSSAKLSVTLTPSTVNVSTDGSVGVQVTAEFPGLELGSSGFLSLEPNDAVQSRLVLDLTSCSHSVVQEKSTWNCPQWVLPQPILDGTTYHLTRVDLSQRPSPLASSPDEPRHHSIAPAATSSLEVPFYLLPRVSLNVLSSTLLLDSSSAANLSFYDNYTNYWVFLVGGDNGAMYYRDSVMQASGSSPAWAPLNHSASAGLGLTGMCYFNKSMVLVVGSRNYTTDVPGPGFVMLGLDGHFTTVLSTGATALMSVLCKSPGALLPFIAVGMSSTILVSDDGLQWVAATVNVSLSTTFVSVSCLSESVCLALGKWEQGLNWKTVVAKTVDSGQTWTEIYTLSGERAMDLSCVMNSATCYFSTEIYTGSMLHKTVDAGRSFSSLARWDVLSNVRLHCYWTDQCIAGAGSWLGRWDFPAQIRMTTDGGYTWSTTLMGRIGDFVGDCRCGGINNEMCVCTVNNRVAIYSVTNGTWTNITLGATLGPMADFESYFAGDILADFYSQANGRQWLNNDNWLIGNPCSHNWYGVLCDGSSGSASDVISIKLSANGLNGSLSALLGLLPRLRTMELEVNQLRGTIPSSFGQLSNLQHLSLYNNLLTGSITPELGYCSSLQLLALFNNQLSGSIPANLGLLVSLKSMFLYNNQLSGTLPPHLGNLSALHWLDLHNNKLQGALPPELSKLPNLRALDLSRNQLTGRVPDSWSSLTQLTFFDISDNSMSDYSFVNTPAAVDMSF